VCGLYLGNSLLLLALALANSVRGTIAAHRSVKHIAEVCGPGTYWYDGNKVLIRYDMLPTYHGVSIVSRLPTSADLAAGVALPLTLMKGQQDTVHIESCQTGYRN
jgi:hypothetical protein